MVFDNIPFEMRQCVQWVLWRYEETDGDKPTKVPYSPIAGCAFSLTDHSAWGTFEQAVAAYGSGNFYSGIGFVLTKNDPYSFIDLDDTKGDQSKLDRQIKIYNEFNSYAERSPSGTGLHIILRGSIPSGRKRDSIEIYSDLRYMTMTGDVYRNEPIKDYHELLNSLYEQMSKGKVASTVYGISEPESLSDEKILEIAQNAENKNKFNALLSGDFHEYYQSQSEADFAFINILTYYSHNAEQVKRIFKASALGQRNKQTTIGGVDYLSHMVNRSFDRMLPPVDIEGLRNQINELLDRRKNKPSEIPPLIQPEANVKIPEISASKSLYSVPPGLVGEVAQFIYAQAPRPVPEIALAGALGLVAGIVGRAYNISGTGLNQYVLLLAPTGTGKEAIAGGIDKLMSAVVRTVPAAIDFIGPGEIASSQALIKYMSKSANSFVSLVGEFGIYLQQMASVNAPPHLIGLRRMLLDLYNKSGEGKVLRPSIYSDKEKNTNAVNSPALTLLGESTPEKFYEGLHEGMISEGLLPRFNIIEYHGERTALNPAHIHAKPSFELIDKLSTICAHALMLNSQHKAIHVQTSQEAKKLFDLFDVHCDTNINSSDREIRRHLWNRAHIKALKLAALIAVGCNPYNPEINLEVANWAIDLTVLDVRNMLNRFDSGEIGIDNDETKQLLKTAQTVKDYLTSTWDQCLKYAGEGGSKLHYERIIPYSYIQRRLASVAVFRKDKIGSSGSIKRAIKTLVERGDLREVSKATMAKDYNIASLCYMVNNPKAFEL